MKKIVIIDDSAPFTLLIKQLLETEDVIVESYEDAADFLKIPSRIIGYDLIILDIHLPDVGGLDVLESLKNKLATKDIPVLLLSGDSRSEMVIRGMRMGAIDFMTKPIDPAQLIKRVLDHLDRGINQS